MTYAAFKQRVNGLIGGLISQVWQLLDPLYMCRFQRNWT